MSGTQSAVKYAKDFEVPADFPEILRNLTREILRENPTNIDKFGPSDFRHMSVENNVLPHVNGSSRIKVADSIDILCSVKVEVSEPTTLSPDCGLFEVAIELSPSCNLKLDDRRLIEHGNQIAQQLQYFIASSKTFDMESLCIIPGKFCWNVCVDLLVLQMDGDPLDACSIATYIALNCTKIPKIEVYVGESGFPEDFEVTGDLGEAILLNARDIPICVSSCKIGSTLILDGTGAEQACASSIFAVAVNRTGDCCGFNSTLGGHFEAIDIASSLLNAKTSSTATFAWIDECYSSTSASSTLDNLYPDVPPIRKGLFA